MNKDEFLCYIKSKGFIRSDKYSSEHFETMEIYLDNNFFYPSFAFLSFVIYHNSNRIILTFRKNNKGYISSSQILDMVCDDFNTLFFYNILKETKRIDNLNEKYRAEGFLLVEDYNKVDDNIFRKLLRDLSIELILKKRN